MSSVPRHFLPLFLLTLFLACPNGWARNKRDDISKIGKRNIEHKSIIAVAKEQEIGRQYAKEIDSKAKLITDPVVVQYVDRVAKTVAQNSDLKIPLVVKVVDLPTPDGSVLPGGFIYINTGFIRAANGEGEVAAFFAYGIADIATRHWAREQTRATLLQYAMVPLVFSPKTYGQYNATMQAYTAGAPLSFLKFSREDVAESDYFALQYLYKAGYDPESYIAVLERFAKIEDAQKIPETFRDHPPARQRIANCRKEIAKILPPRTISPAPNDDLERVKALLFDATAPKAAP